MEFKKKSEETKYWNEYRIVCGMKEALKAELESENSIYHKTGYLDIAKLAIKNLEMRAKQLDDLAKASQLNQVYEKAFDDMVRRNQQKDPLYQRVKF